MLNFDSSLINSNYTLAIFCFIIQTDTRRAIMKKNRPSKRKKQTSQENSTKSSTIIGIISLLFSLVAIIVSMTSFFLPLIRTRLVIENPAKIYSLRNNEGFDELIIPIIINNYGSYIRSVNDIECSLKYNEFEIPMRPVYVYDNINLTVKDRDKRLYSSFIVAPNSGDIKYVGFVFDDVNFTHKNKIPETFHFKSDSSYSFNARFYTTRNSFKNNDREIIQIIYAFETGKVNEANSMLSFSKLCWLKKNDSQILPGYK